MEAFFVDSFLFSQSINVRGLPLSACHFSLHYLPRCLRSTISCNKTYATEIQSEPLQICCHVIVTQ